MDQASIQETTKEAFVSVPYIQGLSEEFTRIFKDTKVHMILKGCTTLKTMFMHPKDKIHTQLCQDVVYQLTCTEENCNSSHIGEYSRCLESRIKEHITSATSAIFQHSSINNHPKADIC